jgi:hypothetical protein
MFVYRSVQYHSNVVNGKEKTKTQRVDIKGNQGWKSVTIKQNKGARKTSKKRLTQKEIRCIKKCKFIPGLFSDCCTF